MRCYYGNGFNKKISELLESIHEQFGNLYTVESDFKFSQEYKAELSDILFNQRKLPDFGYPVKEVSYRDGVKVYFENDGWIIARFSGTEPLIRIFSEMPTEAEAMDVNVKMQKFLKLS